MTIPIKCEEEYFLSKERTVLTTEQIEIPGLRVFARHAMPYAIEPLSLHYHENAFEFIFIMEGVFSFQCGGRDYKVNGGDVFVSYPNEVHSTNQVPLSLGEICWFQLDISSIKNLLFLSDSAAANLVMQLNSIKHHVYKTDNKEMRNVLKKAFTLAASTANKYLTATYITLFLNLLIKYTQEFPITLSPDIEKALNYILDNFTQDILLEDLSEYCHLSVSQFKQKFKNQVGISPRCFINLQKVEYAKLLLMDGASKTDIAMLTGFDSSSYFASVFKKFTSVTPSEFVAQNRLKTDASDTTKYR